MLFSFGSAIAAEPVRIAVTVEMTGGAASLGDYWTKGVKQAVKEINAAGGILGRPVEYKIFDTQSKPAISVAAVKKGLAWKPFSLSGPIYSSSTLANMFLSQESKTPQFVGSENWRISTKGSMYIWRTSTQQGFEMPKLLNWVMGERKPKRVAMLHVNNDYGIGAKETVVKYLGETWNTKLVAAMACEEKQADYSAELATLKRKKADAVLAYLLEEEAAIFFRQLRKMGLKLKVVFGPNSAISEDTRRLAKEAADGVYGMTGFEYTSPEPNSQRLAKIYHKLYNDWPDNEFMKGYNSIYLPKTGIELAGGFDKVKFSKVMHKVFITPKVQKNICGGNLYYDEFGDLHAWDYLTKVVWDGKRAKPFVAAALPPLKGPDSKKKPIYYKK
jgi:branched-chain amino acid transport system substrate-binding protein